MDKIKTWFGLASDLTKSFMPGWRWVNIKDVASFKGIHQVEPYLLQRGSEDWYIGLMLNPQGWVTVLIHDRKIIGQTTAGQFQKLFGIWNVTWLQKLMFSRLRWERQMGWKPGSNMVVSVSYGLNRYDNWRERIAARNAEDDARLSKLRKTIEQNTESGIITKTPEGRRQLVLPAGMSDKLIPHLSDKKNITIIDV